MPIIPTTQETEAKDQLNSRQAWVVYKCKTLSQSKEVGRNTVTSVVEFFLNIQKTLGSLSSTEKNKIFQASDKIYDFDTCT